MKLITKTTLLYLLITALVLSGSGLLLFLAAENFIEKQIHRYFSYREDRLLKRLDVPQPDLAFLNSFKSQRVVARPELQAPVIQNLERDTLMFNEMAGQIQPYRSRTFDKKVNGRVYRLSIFVSVQDYRLLLHAIIKTVSYIFLALLVLLLLLNYLSSRYLWRPFYHTLDQIKHYSINQREPLVLSPTTTREFKELNLIFSQMISRIEHDFRNMKEFTENISHEIQTPLAVIKAKIEMLLKSGSPDQSQYKAINAVYLSTSRLSKLSKTLGLLSKINNQEFVNKESILLKPFISNILFNFKELAELKEVKIQEELDESAQLYIDPYLLDVLLSNLLKNALSHNFPNGEIQVVLQPQRITLSNTGGALNFPQEQLFDRFRRNTDKPNSLGLGLSIVRKICDMNQIGIRYHYEQDRHVFELIF
jgi:signal transduction histidine kinase